MHDSDPNVSEEAKENSRRKLEVIEGADASDADAFTASAGTEKREGHNRGSAAERVDSRACLIAVLCWEQGAAHSSVATECRRAPDAGS